MTSFKQLVVKSFLFVGLSVIGQHSYSMEIKPKFIFDTTYYREKSLNKLCEEVKQGRLIEFAEDTLRSNKNKLLKYRSRPVQYAAFDLVYELLNWQKAYDLAPLAIQPFMGSQDSCEQMRLLNFVWRWVMMDENKEEAYTIARKLVIKLIEEGNLSLSSSNWDSIYLQVDVLQLLRSLVEQKHEQQKESCELAQRVILLLKDSKNVLVLLHLLDDAYRLVKYAKTPDLFPVIKHMLSELYSLIENKELGGYLFWDVARENQESIQSCLQANNVSAIDQLSDEAIVALLRELVG